MLYAHFSEKKKPKQRLVGVKEWKKRAARTREPAEGRKLPGLQRPLKGLEAHKCHLPVPELRKVHVFESSWI